MTFAGFWAGKNIPNVFCRLPLLFSLFCSYFILFVFLHVKLYYDYEEVLNSKRELWSFMRRGLEECIYIYASANAMPTATSFYDWSIHHPNLPPSEIRLKGNQWSIRHDPWFGFEWIWWFWGWIIAPNPGFFHHPLKRHKVAAEVAAAGGKVSLPCQCCNGMVMPTWMWLL